MCCRFVYTIKCVNMLIIIYYNYSVSNTQHQLRALRSDWELTGGGCGEICRDRDRMDRLVAVTPHSCVPLQPSGTFLYT